MNDLIEALQIFLKYTDTKYPTHCEHDILTVNVDPALVSKEDKERLHDLDFDADDTYCHFYSYRFGSC